MPDVIRELLATEAALDKLGARRISTDEARQVPGNRHITIRNPRAQTDPVRRRLMIGHTDGDLATIDSRCIEAHDGDPEAKLRILLSVEGEDALRLQRIAAARGQKPGAVIAELLRDADRPAA